MSITDTALHNKQIFSIGNIQVSPQHMVQLNMQSPTLFNPSGSKLTSASGYKVFLTGYAQYVLSREINEYKLYSLNNKINQLRANPRPL
ncbi:MAG: hypothetical protein OQK58_01320, partial [Gammaproteobacteria bacterium]|nr:hypothetical protein [Gammaproteobacteria bacterium]